MNIVACFIEKSIEEFVVITHKSITLKKVVGEGLDGCPGERGDRLPNGA
jgi:hypothetical protein